MTKAVEMQPVCIRFPKRSSGVRELCDSLPKLPDFDAYQCPRGKNMLLENEKAAKGKFVRVPCRGRKCPVCGPVWTRRYQILVRWMIERHPGPFYWFRVPRSGWRTASVGFRRGGAQYFAAEVDPGVLDVIATSPTGRAVPTEITRETAVEYALAAIENARHVVKPILLSPGWKLPASMRRSRKKGKGTPEGGDWRKVGTWGAGEVNLDDLRASLEVSGVSWREIRCGWGRGVEFDLPPGTTSREFLDRMLRGPQAVYQDDAAAWRDKFREQFKGVVI